MSEMERASALLNMIPQSKLAYVIGYLQGIMADEAADDAFCENMYQQYLNDPDRGDFVPLDDAVKEQTTGAIFSNDTNIPRL